MLAPFDELVETLSHSYPTHVDGVACLHMLSIIWVDLLHFITRVIIVGCLGTSFMEFVWGLTSCGGYLAPGVCTWSLFFSCTSLGDTFESTLVDFWSILAHDLMVYHWLHTFGGGLEGQTLDPRFFLTWSSIYAWRCEHPLWRCLWNGGFFHTSWLILMEHSLLRVISYMWRHIWRLALFLEVDLWTPFLVWRFIHVDLPSFMHLEQVPCLVRLLW